MAVKQYGSYFLISRPYQDELQRWLPYAFVSWLDGSQLRYHLIKDLNGIFDNEEEALDFGFDAGRSWIKTER